MAEKGITMVLNVDLQCSKCYKKVRKLLCKFPEIRDREYDEKANKVTIKVVCCSPEKIREKLCSKGGGCIKSIEIKKPDPKPKPQPQPQPQPKPPSQPQPKPPSQPPTTPKPKPKDEPAKPSLDLELRLHLEGRPVPPPPVPPPPKIPPIPLGFCCSECYSGRPGGPCSRGQQVHYDLCYGRPVYDSWGGYGSGCGYFSEEGQQGCSIM